GHTSVSRRENLCEDRKSFVRFWKLTSTAPTKNSKTRRGRIRDMSIGSVTRRSQAEAAGIVASARTTVSGGYPVHSIRCWRVNGCGPAFLVMVQTTDFTISDDRSKYRRALLVPQRIRWRDRRGTVCRHECGNGGDHRHHHCDCTKGGGVARLHTVE